MVTWLFADIHGTVDTQTVAASGVTTKQYRDPFGMPIGGTSGVWGDGNGFLNKPLTASTGLTGIGARNYDPKLGKFISVDPVVDPRKPLQNTGYAYSGNNPVTFSDPTGLYREEGCGRIGKCGAFEAANAQGNKNPTNPLSLSGQGGSSSCSGWSLRCGRQWGGGGGRSMGGAGAAPWFNWPAEYRMGASTGGKRPELTNVLKVATSTTMPNVAVGLAGTDFMHQFPAIRIIANAPVSLTGIIMAHVTGGDGCAIAATGTIVCGGSFNPGGPGTGGMMVGDTFITAESAAGVMARPRLLDHESRHSEQWAGFGPVNFIASYLANNVISEMTVGDRACGNYFEGDAGFGERGYDYC